MRLEKTNIKPSSQFFESPPRVQDTQNRIGYGSDGPACVRIASRTVDLFDGGDKIDNSTYGNFGNNMGALVTYHKNKYPDVEYHLDPDYAKETFLDRVKRAKNASLFYGCSRLNDEELIVNRLVPKEDKESFIVEKKVIKDANKIFKYLIGVRMFGKDEEKMLANANKRIRVLNLVEKAAEKFKEAGKLFRLKGLVGKKLDIPANNNLGIKSFQGMALSKLKKDDALKILLENDSPKVIETVKQASGKFKALIRR